MENYRSKKPETHTYIREETTKLRVKKLYIHIYRLVVKLKLPGWQGESGIQLVNLVGSHIGSTHRHKHFATVHKSGCIQTATQIFSLFFFAMKRGILQ